MKLFINSLFFLLCVLSTTTLVAQIGGNDFEMYGNNSSSKDKKVSKDKNAAKDKEKDKKSKKDNKVKESPTKTVVQSQGHPIEATKESELTTTKDGKLIMKLDLGDIYYTANIDTVYVSSSRKKLSLRDEESIKYYYREAIDRIDEEDYESAVKMLSWCLKKDPYNKDLLQLRGNSYVELDMLKKGQRDLEKAANYAPKDPIINYNLGAVNVKLGKTEAAIQNFTKAINEKPDYVLAYQGRASANISARNFTQAIADFNQVIDFNGLFAPAYQGRGIAKCMVGGYYDAIKDFSTNIALDPNNGLAFYYRGLAYLGINERDEACKDFQTAYKLRIPQAFNEIKENCGYSPESY
ncbi:MAG: hypothetical protein R2798_08230 [Chitinophagales bacterium]|nr:hypothetical protein [Bacteroidota bacterium]MCB9042422.1 hypothetical protein [Chitinophagales bacterium]